MNWIDKFKQNLGEFLNNKNPHYHLQPRDKDGKWTFSGSYYDMKEVDLVGVVPGGGKESSGVFDRLPATEKLAAKLNDEWGKVHKEDVGPFWNVKGENNPYYITVRDSQNKIIAGATTVQKGMRTEILSIASHSRGSGKKILDRLKKGNRILVASSTKDAKDWYLRNGFKEDNSRAKEWNVIWRKPST